MMTCLQGFRMIAGQSAARTKKQPINARDNYIVHDCLGGKETKYEGFPLEPCPDKVWRIHHYAYVHLANGMDHDRSAATSTSRRM